MSLSESLLMVAINSSHAISKFPFCVCVLFQQQVNIQQQGQRNNNKQKPSRR